MKKSRLVFDYEEEPLFTLPTLSKEEKAALGDFAGGLIFFAFLLAALCC